MIFGLHILHMCMAESRQIGRFKLYYIPNYYLQNSCQNKLKVYYIFVMTEFGIAWQFFFERYLNYFRTVFGKGTY